MKSVPKLIKRYVGILMFSSFLIVVINFTILAVIAGAQKPNSSPWETAKQAAQSMEKSEQGWRISDQMAKELDDEGVWAVYLDDATGACVWHSANLPDTVPLEYTVSDIADLTRGYLEGYPTFTGKGDGGLMILGYPKESYWKHMWPSWDYQFIANLPRTILAVLAVNVLIILFIYTAANAKLLKSVKPITDGIQALPTGQPVALKENGVLSEISVNINRTSEVLQSQKYQLRKKETARANWIAGVSHDIRTPLSMVMGYACQLEGSTQLPEAERQKATVIVRQSQRMKNLINDLNLASKLEYNMQPIHREKICVIAAVRQVVVDFINLDIDGKHPIRWITGSDLHTLIIPGDKDLIKRAVGNLIQNSINHNPDGCTIFVEIKESGRSCDIIVSDDGIGASDEQIDKLNHSPHYMVCDEQTSEQRHGLGLLIVKQIAAAHKGTVEIGHSEYGGLEVKIYLPL